MPNGICANPVITTSPRGVSGGRYGAVAISPAETGGGGQAPFQFRMASFIELQIIGGATRREAFIANVSVLPSSEVPSIRQQVGDRVWSIRQR